MNGTLAGPTSPSTTPDTGARTVARFAALGFAATGAAFLVYPAVRPWHDETTLAGAAGMASPSWVVAHLSAVAGFITLTLSLLAVRSLLRGTRGSGASLAALLLTWVGVGLTLPYYGAEVFGVPEAAAQALREHSATLLVPMTDAIRFQPAAVTMFALGLALLGAGAVAAAVAVARSGRWNRWTAAPMAVGFALFIPQFFAGETVRIAHGALIAAGCAWLAVSLLRTRTVSLESARRR
ncbi:MAG TPA: hypothetical protein VGL93_01380 [Streptosporangiaceae bacterium]|jgi:hypothetical protein